MTGTNRAMDGLKELIAGCDRSKVAGISFGGQMHGLVVLDEKDAGHPSGDPLE